MIVFKTFWRIMKRYWWIVFIYVAILTSLSVINLKTAPVTDFVDTKPEITIVSQDSSDLATKPFTKNFLNYLSKNTKIINLFRHRRHADRLRQTLSRHQLPRLFQPRLPPRCHRPHRIGLGACRHTRGRIGSRCPRRVRACVQQTDFADFLRLGTNAPV